MSSAKEDILARIRSSLADAPVAPEPDVTTAASAS